MITSIRRRSRPQIGTWHGRMDRLEVLAMIGAWVTIVAGGVLMPLYAVVHLFIWPAEYQITLMLLLAAAIGWAWTWFVILRRR